jgi:L-cysteine desulfidase
MDLGTTIIGIICVALCAMPFVLTIGIRKKKEKQLLESIKDLAKQKNCEINHHEICGNYVIGIDEAKNFLFFQLNEKEKEKQQFVNLSTIKSCNVSNINRIIKNNKIIERLNLEFTLFDKNRSNVVLEFYNVDLSCQLNGELQSIEKWNGLIKKRLDKNK